MVFRSIVVSRCRRWNPLYPGLPVQVWGVGLEILKGTSLRWRGLGRQGVQGVSRGKRKSRGVVWACGRVRGWGIYVPLRRSTVNRFTTNSHEKRHISERRDISSPCPRNNEKRGNRRLSERLNDRVSSTCLLCTSYNNILNNEPDWVLH